MKNIRYILPAILALTLCSCDIQIDDTFADDAQSRLAKANELNIKNLVSAQNGWIMEYYPHPTRTYGGYNILVRFDEEGYCYMLSEKATAFTPDDVRKSEYRVVSDQGSVLSFCTYNNYIHDFADPASTQGDGVRYGYRGDFEFAIKSSSEEEIVLQGVKTNNIIKMYPMPLDVEWKDYLTDCKQADNIMNTHLFSGYEATVNGVSIGELSVKSYPVLILPDPVEGNPEQKKQVAFKYTPKGIKLYEPATISGAPIHELELSQDGKQLISVGTDQQVTLSGTYVEGFIPYNEYLGTWDFHSTFRNIVDLVITIEAKEQNRVLVMKGFPYSLEVPVTYNRETGTLTIANLTNTERYVGAVNSETGATVNVLVYIRMARNTSYNMNLGFDLIGENSQENGHLRVDWVDNGMWTANSASGGARGFDFFYYNPADKVSLVRALTYQDINMVKRD